MASNTKSKALDKAKTRFSDKNRHADHLARTDERLRKARERFN